MTTPINSVVELMLSQEGDRYVFGVEVSLSDTNPAAFDCSELVQWACARAGVSPTMPDGSWIQARHCKNYGTLIPVEEAIGIRGALLFRFSSDPFSGVRPSSAHVAMSLGNGKTIEARGTRYGVGIFSALDRGWTHAARIPGCDYPTTEARTMNLYPLKGDVDDREARDFSIETIQLDLAYLAGVSYSSGKTATAIAQAGMELGSYDDAMKELVAEFTDTDGAGIGPRELFQIRRRVEERRFVEAILDALDREWNRINGSEGQQ